MFVLLLDITLPPEHAVAALATTLAPALATLPALADHWVAPTMPALSANAGQLVARLVFADERRAQHAETSREWREHVSPLLTGTQVARVGYSPIMSGAAEGGPGIWRALLVKVLHGTPAAQVAAFERDLLLMPDHVSTIRSWSLGSVTSQAEPGAFTHVWEQEFDDAAGFTGEYMHHPVHWGVVDGWFDPETAHCIVAPLMVQLVGSTERPLIQ
ncbi:Dabb family protein [Haliea sp. E17]|uniref:Dabb family protein n=1 Tax=Haliea sp. E17 TaxID=3401576 RepID=UPI003AAEAD27